MPITKPPPIPPRALPDTLPEQPIAPRPGRWVWTCRAGFEAHLYEELAWARVGPRVLGEALVEGERPPKEAPPAFARLGFIAWGTIEGPLDDQAVLRAAEIVKRNASGRPLHLQAWTLDTATANPLSEQALAFQDAVTARLAGVNLLETAQLARQRNAGVLAQLCVVSATRVVVGGVPAGEALSLAPGGRMRMRRTEDAPSRASAKLDEALELMGLEPQAGDTCVDLGAAPGGWTRRLVARGARVIAVDPAKLAPDLERHKKVTHVQQSAFAFAPEEPADWLFCDMAWRPLEVAQLLAKWSRRAWAQTLVANIKLPMKDKNPVLYRVKHILTEGGWKHLSVRQLYHDRDEVTVMARRN